MTNRFAQQMNKLDYLNQKGLTNQFNARFWVYLFIGLHLLCWTIVPALVRYNLPLDAIEGTIWGHQLEWGYDKNPFLNGWLTALAVYFSDQSGWAVYLFSQISVGLCFWAVWKLAKDILSPLYALIAVMLLEGIQYYNFHSIDFNDNTLELGLWALTIYCFYKALRSPSIAYWLLTGCFAGLGMMAKYYTAALLAAMAIYLFAYPENRKLLKTLPPYLGIGAFLMIILPHTIWLFYHDFITVKYVFDRAASKPSFTNHIFFPAQFAWQQLQAFSPALILFALLFIGKKPLLADTKLKLASFDKAFLFYLGLGPFLLTILLSIIFGITLRAGWGMPLLSLWGIILLAWLQPTLTRKKIYAFITLIFVLLATLLSGYYFSLTNSSDASSANFPGREIAATITKNWRDKYHTKLIYVAGSRWVGGNIGFYSPDHPAVFVEWDKRRAPWINVKDFERKGAVFVWSITDNESMPEEIKKQFPSLMQTDVITFSWKRNKNNLAPIKIGIAILPPGFFIVPDFQMV